MCMQSGQCKNCGADYGPDDMFCSFCGSPIEREQEGYGGFDQQSYKASNGGTQVIQNIYVNSNGTGDTHIADVLGNMGANFRQNNAADYRNRYTLVRNRIVAGILAIILGFIGVQFFYLNKIVSGILCVMFWWTGIPCLIGIIQGVCMLKMSNMEFEVRYHVRTS